ncbi:MAG: hypothetical protein R2778_06110 [Saprospiraceae bacterium]
MGTFWKARMRRALTADFASLPGYKILVRGGGNVATEIGEKMGLKSEYIQGRRITDETTIELVTMVYGGLINRKIVKMIYKPWIARHWPHRRRR